MVSPAARKFHGAFSVRKVSKQVIVEEFSAVVAIKSEQIKRQHVFNIFDLFQHPCLASAPDGPLFSPSGGNIDAIDGEGKLTHHGLPTVGHRVGFNKAGTRFIPLIDSDWNLLP